MTASRAWLLTGGAATLAIAMLDLAWLDLWLAPAVIEHRSPAAMTAVAPPEPEPVPEPEVELDPEPEVVSDNEPEHLPPRVVATSAPGCEEAAVLVRKVHFASASSRLDETAAGRVESFARRASARRPNTRVVIDGHADRRGQRARNDRLGLARARAVARHLAAAGIDGAELRSFGARKPIAPPGPETRWQNRRAVLCLIKELSP